MNCGPTNWKRRFPFGTQLHGSPLPMETESTGNGVAFWFIR
uniref:Uncharacterized protein n=1 Tax=Anguilla anguilla TaxID=7936 RepID=A0A0E9SDX7_ANGAN